MIMTPITGDALLGAGTSLFGAGFGLLSNWMNNKNAKEREALARQENYTYGEMAANTADARTRGLYYDLYSPGAQLQQLKDAGLSPSLMYGDGGGISGQSGAMGSGASGISPNVFGWNPVQDAQLGKIIAETENIKADTNLKTSETEVNQERVNNLIQDTNNKYLEGENKVIQNMLSQIELAIKGEYGEKQVQKELEILSYKAEIMSNELREARVKGDIAEASKDDIIKYYQNRTLSIAKDIVLKTTANEEMKSRIKDLASQILTREKLATLKDEEIKNWFNVELKKLGISEGQLNNDDWRVRLQMIETCWKIAKEFSQMAIM